MFHTVSRYTTSAITLIAALGLSPAFADEATSNATLEEALKATKPILNTRLRYETVSQDGFNEDADALTYRLRAGFETGSFNGLKLLVEFDHVGDLVDDYNSTLNGKTAYPVIPDPEVTELNRLQLTYTGIADTTAIVGRQQIAIDDHRFIGHVGWRQNEQTFDGLRVKNTSFGKLKLDAGYINQVNRIFGDESPIGRFEGDSYFFNASHPTELGTLTGFAYMVDVDNGGGANSSQTIGARFAGKKQAGDGTVNYAVSYATQEDWGSSNIDYSADYLLVEGGYATKSGLSFGAGYEVLGGDTARGFQTPLATLHKFQGWTDKFLVTPAAGVEDLYAKVGYKFGDVGPFTGVNALAVYHDFSAETGGSDYGSEIDLQLGGKWQKIGVTLKYADYNADGFSVDTQKVWLQFDFKL